MPDSSIIVLYDVSREYSFYSDIFLLIIGLISNLALILIFVTFRVFRSNQCAFFLTVESIANIGLLLSNLPPYIYTYTTGQDPTLSSIGWCKLQNSLSQAFGLCSLFTICFLTFDQFMSTNPRPAHRQISSLQLAHRLTFVNICFVLLHSIPFLIFTEIRQTEGCTIYNPVLQTYFTFFYYPILSATIPLIVTLTFSLLAYRNVRRIVRRQIAVERRRLDRQLTAMVLARVFCLILFGLPYIIYSLYRVNLSVRDSNRLEVAIAKLVAAITSSLLYLNFAMNFYLFLIVSSRFRRQVRHSLVKKCWDSLISLCLISVCRKNRAQVAPEIALENVSSIESG